MNDNTRREQRAALAALSCLIALLIAGAAPASETAARVTAVVGGANIDRSAAVGDDTSIETAADGNAAMLVDEDSLVELCASTIMTLTRRPDTGNRVIKVGAGTTRIMVEPRGDDEHIQIHTPAAIATILGTVVYVTVDPVTGDTTIASEDNPVRVENADPTVTGSTTINGMESVTLRRGEALSEPTKIARSVLANMGGCLTDLHDAAASLDSAVVIGNVQDRLAMADGVDASLPEVGAGVAAALTVGDPGGDPTENPFKEPIPPPSEPEPPPPPSSELPLPEPCADIPGDACFPFPGGQGQVDY
jgi:hypothetical protein